MADARTEGSNVSVPNTPAAKTPTAPRLHSNLIRNHISLLQKPGDRAHVTEASFWLQWQVKNQTSFPFHALLISLNMWITLNRKVWHSRWLGMFNRALAICKYIDILGEHWRHWRISFKILGVKYIFYIIYDINEYVRINIFFIKQRFSESLLKPFHILFFSTIAW